MSFFLINLIHLFDIIYSNNMDEIIKKTVRKLRRNQTAAERILWERLRRKQILGLKFLRQYPIEFIYMNKRRFFISDFYCNKYKLIIEVDGEIHNQKQDYDLIREKLLTHLGFKIIRFTNSQILNNTNNVVAQITKSLEK